MRKANIKGKRKMAKKMGLEFWLESEYWKDKNMKGSSRKINFMASEYIIMKEVQSALDNGKITQQMGRAYVIMLLETNLKACGKMTVGRREWIIRQMEIGDKKNIVMVILMEKCFSVMRMEEQKSNNIPGHYRMSSFD